MKAMILAAGLGTRLKPLTDSIPKALVEIGGVPMLERVIDNLKRNGFSRITVNVHHFADKVTDFLNSGDFGVEITVSDERESLLDTGGGIVKALPLLFDDDDSPVLVHNVDIISNADFKVLMDSAGSAADVALLVSNRDSTRKLVFDGEMTLRGWHDLKNSRFRPEGLSLESMDPSGNSDFKELAFSGIYVLTKDAAVEMKELMGESKFSVIDYFLHPDRKSRIKGVAQSDLKLIDIGKPATLSQASELYLNN